MCVCLCPSLTPAFIAQRAGAGSEFVYALIVFISFELSSEPFATNPLKSLLFYMSTVVKISQSGDFMGTDAVSCASAGFILLPWVSSVWRRVDLQTWRPL